MASLVAGGTVGVASGATVVNVKIGVFPGKTADDDVVAQVGSLHPYLLILSFLVADLLPS